MHLGRPNLPVPSRAKTALALVAIGQGITPGREGVRGPEARFGMQSTQPHPHYLITMFRGGNDSARTNFNRPAREISVVDGRVWTFSFKFA